MAEGKESVLYALPFCAGTVTGIFICGRDPAYSSGVYILACAMSVAGIGLAFLSTALTGIEWKYRLRNVLLPAAVFCCGVFCWTTHSICSLQIPDFPMEEGRSAVERITAPAARWLEESIDSLPLKDCADNALVKALVTGDQSDVPGDVRKAFRDSGASHILALSGIHLAVIYLILTRALSILGQSRKADIARFTVIISSTLFYSVMTGSSASIIRAFLFILLRETALLSGRKAGSANILCAALTIQCALNPGVIVSAGFQLSYLAMCGIYFLYPVLRDMYPSPVPVIKKIWDSAAMSIACQVFTGPLAWFLFGSAPPYFIITNLIAVPLTSALMPVALAAAFLYRMGICPDMLSEGISLCCEIVIRCLEIICQLP